MTETRLYAVTIPQGVRVETDAVNQQQQQIQALLRDDAGAVTPTGQDPEERPITLEFPGTLAELRASEIRETGQGLSTPLPFYGVSIPTGTPDDGYYSVSSVDEARPLDPRTNQYQRVRLSLTKQGTPASHFRAVKTRPTAVDNPFSTGSGGRLVAVDDEAAKTRWFNAETGQTAVASSIGFVSGDKGDIELYDVNNAPFDQPELLFELPLRREGLVDPRVFDPKGASARFSQTDALQFQKVFAPAHRFDDRTQILDNTRLRVRVDESATPGISAERFNSGSFSSVGLPQNTGFQVVDWDIREINPVQVSGVADFSDGSQTVVLRWQMQRGLNELLFSGRSSIPSGLANLLGPIASNDNADVFGSPGSSPQDIRRRSEVLTP
jgi:hypothetical protein